MMVNRGLPDYTAAAIPRSLALLLMRHPGLNPFIIGGCWPSDSGRFRSFEEFIMAVGRATDRKAVACC
jgi:hypothetical protein